MAVDWLDLIAWGLFLVSSTGAAVAVGWLAGRMFLRATMGAQRR